MQGAQYVDRRDLASRCNIVAIQLHIDQQRLQSHESCMSTIVGTPTASMCKVSFGLKSLCHSRHSHNKHRTDPARTLCAKACQVKLKALRGIRTVFNTTKKCWHSTQSEFRSTGRLPQLTVGEFSLVQCPGFSSVLWSRLHQLVP